MSVTIDQERRGAEQWFRRRGLPAVVRGRTGQIVVRTMPAVVGLMLYELVSDVLDFADGDTEAAFISRMENVAYVLLYFSLLLGWLAVPPLGAWLAARQTRQWVLRAGGFLPAALLTACYVFVEPIVDHWLLKTPLLTSLGGNLAIWGVLCALTAFGIGSIFCWALRAAVRQLRGIGMMTSRSLPLLLLVTTFGFFTAEIWQAVGPLPNNRIWLIVGFFGVIAAAFLFSVLSAELQTVAALSESTEPAGPSHDFPFAVPADGAQEAIEPAPPLTRAERANMVLILLLTQALQAMVFGVLVFALYVTLGLLAVPKKVMTAWANQAVTPGGLFDFQIPIANELLHVSMLIAAFAGLYFIVTVVTDAAHRSTFYEPVLDHLKVSLAARAAYLTRFATQSPEVSPR